MCSYQRSGGITYRHQEEVGLVAATTAHEMGHSFGMNHDSADCKCPDRFCIMRFSTSEEPPVHWSSCSIRELHRSFDKGLDYCLRNKPKRLFISPTCGNGFVEKGEDCDCGLLLNKNKLNECHACCNPRTCKLRANAACASGECCDTSKCRLKSVGTVCRSVNSAIKECDLPEYCDGKSEFCPKDVFKMDSTPCGKHKEAFCAAGSCKSHRDQCRTLWGSTANDDAKCYEQYNTRGAELGNCGYDRVTSTYTACSPEDALCGRLQCLASEDVKLGTPRTRDQYPKKISVGVTARCRTAHVDLGLSTVDPGLVSDGAKCGDNKMCFKQRCVAIKLIRSKIAARTTSSVCPSKHPTLDCNGNGVCNSEGHCHCLPGFAPPDCSLPGAGGSVDSGPASDTRGSRPHDIKSTVGGNRPTTDVIRPTTAINRPSTFNRPTTIVNQPTTEVNRLTTIINRHTTIVNRPTTVINRHTIIVNRPTTNVNRPTSGFSQPTTNANRPTTRVNQPTPNVNRSTTDSNGVSPKCITNCSDSDDFKPPFDHSVHYNFMVAMYVIFLGILPLVLLIIFLYCYSRHNTIFCCQSGYKTQHRSFYNKSPSIAVITSFIHNFIPVGIYDISNNRTSPQETSRSDSTQKTTPESILNFNTNRPQILHNIPLPSNSIQTTHRKSSKEDIYTISHKTDSTGKTSLTHNNELSRNVGNREVTKNVLKPTSRPPPPPIPYSNPKPLVKSKPPVTVILPHQLIPPVKSNLSISTEYTPTSVNSTTMGLVSPPNRALMIARDLERVFAARK